MKTELLPCPFCSGEAYIDRYGDKHQSTIYECGSCGCRLETCEEFNHGQKWNERNLTKLSNKQVWDCWQRSHGNTEYAKAMSFSNAILAEVQGK